MEIKSKLELAISQLNDALNKISDYKTIINFWSFSLEKEADMFKDMKHAQQLLDLLCANADLTMHNVSSLIRDLSMFKYTIEIKESENDDV